MCVCKCTLPADGALRWKHESITTSRPPSDLRTRISVRVKRIDSYFEREWTPDSLWLRITGLNRAKHEYKVHGNYTTQLTAKLFSHSFLLYLPLAESEDTTHACRSTYR